MKISTFLKIIKKNAREKKALVVNFFSLSALQVANYVFPLLTLPYLVRILGPEKFGLIAFAQAFVQYFNILTDYGFGLSATREISVNREDMEKVCEIFSSVIVIKGMLVCLSLGIMSLIIFSFAKFQESWFIYYLTFGGVVGQAFFPIWFFQGMERMKYITILDVTAKAVFTFSVFIFVHDAPDYVYVPLLNSLGSLIAGFLAMRIILGKFGIKFYFPRIAVLMHYFKDSTQFFLSRASLSVYTYMNTFVLGLFLNNTLVGYYSIAQKLYIALKRLYQPLANTLYPYIAYKKDVRLYRKVFGAVIVLNTGVLIVVFILSDWIIELLFGAGLSVSSTVFRILVVAASLSVPSILLGYPFLAALGYPRYANMSVIVGAGVHFVGLSVFMFLHMISVYTVASMVIVTEGVVLWVRVYGSMKHGLWNVK